MKNFVLSLVAGLVCSAAFAADLAPAYHLAQSVSLGAPAKWDYLVLDPASHRLFIAHGSEIVVVDATSGAVLGRVAGIVGAHGVAIVPEAGRGYAANGKKGTTTVFDLATLTAVGEIPCAEDPDAVVFDPVSRRVMVMNGDAHSVSVIDPASNRVVATIALPGQPEYAVADGRGDLFVNIVDRAEIVRVAIATATITAAWPIPACERPHGLTMDRGSRRLFSSCANSHLAVLDADSGRSVAGLAIGKGSDAAVFDPIRRLVFSSNGSGTVSVVAEAEAESFRSLGEVPTFPGARTMAEDPETGRLFLVAAENDGARLLIYAPGP